jgi:hypothetical protein
VLKVALLLLPLLFLQMAPAAAAPACASSEQLLLFDLRSDLLPQITHGPAMAAAQAHYDACMAPAGTAGQELPAPWLV